MPPLLAIVADDLTGALDAAAPFAGRGLRVIVALGPDHIPQALDAAPEVIALTTDSREITPDLACDAMARAVQALPKIPIFKKIDSRLKGNIAAELSALSYRTALMAPAIPEFGRIVRAGAVSGFGVTVPIPVADCLGPQIGRIDIPDIASTQDMRNALAAQDYDLLIGARGLADALALRMTGRDLQPFDRLPGPRGLFVIGSRDPITIDQVAELRAMPGSAYLAAPNGQALPTEFADVRRIIVQAVPGTAIATGDQVAVALAALADAMVAPGIGTAFLTGGETARAFLRHRGAKILSLFGECLPGLVVSDAHGLTIVTKSGGFGDRRALSQVAGMIDGEAQ